MNTVGKQELSAEGWICQPCQAALEKKPVNITYMGSVFQVELPICPKCGHTLIPPALALGKMLEAEKILEDK